MSRINGDKNVFHDIHEQDKIKNTDKESKVSKVSKKQVKKHLVSSSLGENVSGKALKVRGATVAEDVLIKVKDNDQLIREDIEKCVILHSRDDKVEYMQVVLELKMHLQYLQQPELVFNYIEDLLPVDVKNLLIERYIELNSLRISKVLAEENLPSTPEQQYNKISRILEAPFSESSPLRLLIKHSFISDLKRFGQAETFSQWAINRFLFNIYYELVHILDAVEIPTNLRENQKYIESRNERKMELEFLKSQL